MRSRARFWLSLAGPVPVGAVFGATAPRELLDPAVVDLFAYFLLPANLYLYGVNDVFDAATDRENPPGRGDPSHTAGRR